MKDLVALIYNNLEVKLLPFECLLICILFTTIEYTKQKLPIFATIICHGYATASSIADVCNKMLKRHVFNAIDMPYTMSIREVCNHFKKIIYYNNDRDILRLVQEQTIITYKFFEKKEAKYLIIFVSEIGSDIAAQVAQLFMKSMPKVIEVEVKCFDSLAFINLYNQGEFDKNQILFIATTINLGIDFKSIIAIEDIVTFNNLDLIQEKLSSFFSNEDYQKFEKQLMKNFSLQNVVGELTILNADKALNAVGMMIDELQIQLHQTFLAKTIIGLNIHLCCLIERLIKKEEIVSHINIVDFEKNNQEFINGVRISFKAIANQYNITIPISEIAYIYDYVLNNYKTDMSIDEI
ncbi:pRD domain protein [Coprobacillus sp. CAG:183]|nr:pRD domain protein [Coprobacillus sp. CAG:183]